MESKVLEQKENGQTRALYEEVFAEDSKEFVDYYYAYMADHNTQWVLLEEEELVSMLHLNPYEVMIHNQAFLLYYIVAVATKESYRHRGYMKRLLVQSMNEMREKRLPFTYLMPAAEAIYTPFGFVTVSGQQIYKGQGSLPGRPAKKGDLGALASYGNHRLAEKYDIYCQRSASYYERMLEEQKSENGTIMVLEDDTKKTSVVKGYYYTAQEGGMQIREPLCEESVVKDLNLQIAEEPKIMVRILDLEMMLNSVESQKSLETFRFYVEDPLLEENTGIYRYENKTWVKSEKDQKLLDIPKYSMEELTRKLFAHEKMYLNEIV